MTESTFEKTIVELAKLYGDTSIAYANLTHDISNLVLAKANLQHGFVESEKLLEVLEEHQANIRAFGDRLKALKESM